MNNREENIKKILSSIKNMEAKYFDKISHVRQEIGIENKRKKEDNSFIFDYIKNLPQDKKEKILQEIKKIKKN